MYDILQLNEMLVSELRNIAEGLQVPEAKKLSKQDLIYKILDQQALKGSNGSTNQPVENNSKTYEILEDENNLRNRRKDWGNRIRNRPALPAPKEGLNRLKTIPLSRKPSLRN